MILWFIYHDVTFHYFLAWFMVYSKYISAIMSEDDCTKTEDKKQKKRKTIERRLDIILKTTDFNESESDVEEGDIVEEKLHEYVCINNTLRKKIAIFKDHNFILSNQLEKEKKEKSQLKARLDIYESKKSRDFYINKLCSELGLAVAVQEQCDESVHSAQALKRSKDVEEKIENLTKGIRVLAKLCDIKENELKNAVNNIIFLENELTSVKADMAVQVQHDTLVDDMKRKVCDLRDANNENIFLKEKVHRLESKVESQTKLLQEQIIEWTKQEQHVTCKVNQLQKKVSSLTMPKTNQEQNALLQPPCKTANEIMSEDRLSTCNDSHSEDNDISQCKTQHTGKIDCNQKTIAHNTDCTRQVSFEELLNISTVKSEPISLGKFCDDNHTITNEDIEAEDADKLNQRHGEKNSCSVYNTSWYNENLYYSPSKNNKKTVSWYDQTAHHGHRNDKVYASSDHDRLFNRDEERHFYRSKYSSRSTSKNPDNNGDINGEDEHKTIVKSTRGKYKKRNKKTTSKK